jgi:hypothetical protein
MCYLGDRFMLSHLSDAELSNLHSLFQQHKLKQNVKRRDDIIEHGYSTKFLMHVCRLALECEQILLTGDLDLKRDSQFLLSIRRGEMSLEDGKKWWASKCRDLETAYANCTAVPMKPDEEKIKSVLLSCLEQHYGSLASAVVRVPQMDVMLNEIEALVAKYKKG